ncbi:MAG: ZIP family metal transporter [Candidatus Altiarchaeota archaeon]
MVLLSILLSVALISGLSLVGVFSLSIGRKNLHELLSLFLAFASGTMLATAFVHMIPEAFHEAGEDAAKYVLLGLIVFFFLERFIHWHHCGKEECHIKPAAYLSIIGDAVHNFFDGAIIASAYLADVRLGLVTTAAIAMHEIPQEFGDFTVLMHSGMKVRKALTYNFISALTAFLGAIIGYVALSQVETLIPYAIAISAGGLIYVSTADLIPELHKEKRRTMLVAQTVALLLGLFIIAAATTLMAH